MRTLGVGIAAIAILGISALLDHESGFGIWLELREDLSRSEMRVSDLVRQNDVMRREIGMLEVEPAAIDRAIREELDLALPGETIVRFKASKIRSGVDFQADKERFWLPGAILSGLVDRETK